MKNFLTGRFMFVCLLIMLQMSCSKSSLIEGVDTPFRYDVKGKQFGWLQVWIVRGGQAETCPEFKIYSGNTYVGKVNEKNLFEESSEPSCGDQHTLNIPMPVGSYTITAEGECGTVTVSKTIQVLQCSTLRIH